MRQLILAAVAGLAAAALGPAQNPLPDPKADPLELELAGLAKQVAAILAKHDQNEVAVGSFPGKGRVPSTFGPEIQRVLLAELRKQKLTINRDSLIELTGDYRPVTENPAEPRLKDMFVRINAQLVNTKTGQQLADIPASRAVYGNEVLSRAYPVPTHVDPAANRQERNDRLRERIEKPASTTAGSRVTSGPRSPFAVEVLVVNNTRAVDPPAGRPVSVQNGLAFVDVKKGEYYRVKVHNDAPDDVAVRVSIDGLDQFVFADEVDINPKTKKQTPLRGEDGRPKFQYRLVPKGSSAVVRGWFRNLSSADSFVVTEYAKSAAAELSANPSEVGQICVQFYTAYESEIARALAEGGPPGGKDAATGRGEPVDQDLKVVNRVIGAMLDVVAVRYTKPKE
jgi:hypothetical protein